MSSNYNLSDFFKNQIDFNQLISTQKRDTETLSEAVKVYAEGTQTIFRRLAEISRENVEEGLKASKDMMTSGKPEINLSKQSEFARSMFESALANLREISETATKLSFEAFDLLNKRAADRMAEISEATGARAGNSNAQKKKASA